MLNGSMNQQTPAGGTTLWNALFQQELLISSVSFRYVFLRYSNSPAKDLYASSWDELFNFDIRIYIYVYMRQIVSNMGHK